MAPGEHVGYPPAGFRAPSDSAELATRHEILKQLGISITTDASAGSCHGVLAPVDDRGDCPETAVTRVAVSMPREVPDGVVPAWRRAGRLAGRQADLAVRLIFVNLSPTGSIIFGTDYFAKKDQYGWEVVAQQPLWYIH